MVKLFDLCYSEYAMGLAFLNGFIGQFYFTKTIRNHAKKQRQTVAFFGIRDYCPRLLYLKKDSKKLKKSLPVLYCN